MRVFKDLKIGDYVYTVLTDMRDSFAPPKLIKLVVKNNRCPYINLLWETSGVAGPTIVVEPELSVCYSIFNYFSDIKVANKYYIEECKKYLSRSLDEAKKLEEKLIDLLSIHFEISEIIENLKEDKE